MKGYEGVRDELRSNPGSYESLDAAQLVKHAFALRTAVQPGGPHEGATPILFYIFAEPERWSDGKPMAEERKARHRQEIRRFAREVAGDGVAFSFSSYRRLLEGWAGRENAEIRAHAKAVSQRFSP